LSDFDISAYNERAKKGDYLPSFAHLSESEADVAGARM
jgi:hypothetical protein